ncbi:family 2 glycosyl transferase [Halosimplex carlsbadense 2-9-1]|uniref:Family 2 glycosyl transferase n=1 Tax=Halosimplex carlsbadense 2-9-1 TaxID=797114 RepID=M0D5V5_9EURY|nr:glycosyltransferase family 2 protein [Halosimplex carlsbadense]ELZ30243.1 family 2 glycosyl transferase [Halosimplex carlsbadense 2-9-1]
MVTHTFRRWLDRTCFALATLAVVTVGFVQGRIAVTIPLLFVGIGGVTVLNATVACLSFAATLLSSGAVFVTEVLRERRRGPYPASGPEIAAIVPSYGDAGALHRSVESLLAADYGDLSVYVVCEPGDESTLSVARSLAERRRVTCLVNDRDPGSKAAAVNCAVDHTDAPYVGVFDADERVHPTFVPAAAAGLADHEAVQGRTVPRPDGLLEAVTYYESVVLGYLSHRLVALLTDFDMVASNALVVRRSTYERVGGYDPRMLTEDFDFAFRCYEDGVSVQSSFAYPSEIEGAHTLRDWWGQRKRWMTGYAQVFHRRLGRLHPIARPRSVASLVFCGGAILGNFVVLSLVPQAVVLAVGGGPAVLAATLGTLAGICLGVRLLDRRVGVVDSVGLGWLLVPFVLPFYSLAAIKGIVEYPISWRGEWFRVEKEG